MEIITPTKTHRPPITTIFNSEIKYHKLPIIVAISTHKPPVITAIITANKPHKPPVIVAFNIHKPLYLDYQDPKIIMLIITIRDGHLLSVYFFSICDYYLL